MMFNGVTSRMMLPLSNHVEGTPETKFMTESPAPSCVSMKSDNSIEQPPSLDKDGAVPESRSTSENARPPAPSCVSMKSGRSIEKPPSLNMKHPVPQSGFNSSPQTAHSIERPLSLSGEDLDPEGGQKLRAEALQEPTLMQITTDFLLHSSQPVNDLLCRVVKVHKTSMCNRNQSLFEGIKMPRNKTPLNSIYTQLYIIEGESEGVNNEHEVLQIEKRPRKQHFHDTSINCLDIFNHIQDLSGGNVTDRSGAGIQKLRTVLTKGIAGIGKTVSVQKFILDWAEEKANPDIDFMFVLPFRELNLIKDECYSLHKLLCDFHPELKVLDTHLYEECKIVFIFDGLDESRLPLDFFNDTKVSDVTMTSSVSTLISNLIKGDLLPSALIWITSRPAAVSQIPRTYIDRVTEIQGFSDTQREEYFRKKIAEPKNAENIISHIKKTRSLYIMCHIPVFCWILATVLQQIMKENNHTEVPKTLSEIYVHFLLIQMNIKNEKYEEKDERDPKKLLETNRAIILKLAHLAFEQLMKGNVMFYEEDLTECGIDLTEALIYSGICTEIFKEESVLFQKKVFCFVHLSFQEFFAALYVFYCYLSKSMKPLHHFMAQNQERSVDVSLDDLLKVAVDKALHTDNGHLDLFLRFLLGISLESNQRLLQGLLTHTHSSSENIQSIANYIKRQIQTEDLPSDRSINLFLCLTEMKDQSLSEEIQEFLKTQKWSEKKLSAAHCTAIAYMLQVSDHVLEELDMKKYNVSEEGCRRLISAVSNCRKARLAGCYLTLSSCETFTSALQLEKSPLRELDLSNNDLQDSGVKLLADGLKSSHCKLEILRLAICNLGEKACEYLASAVMQPHSALRELDLSNNDLQDSGVKMLADGLKSSHCKLEILRLSGCLITSEGCDSLASALSSNLLLLRELDLSYNHPGDSGVKMLSARLKDPDCSLRLDHAGEIRLTAGLRKYACELTLDPNTAHTRLALSEGNRKVTHVKDNQPYPDHPERFEDFKQVMCQPSLRGRCYWEAQWSGGEAVISMSYKGICRKGRSGNCIFGTTKKSWKLDCSSNSYTAWHNKKRTDIPTPTYCSNRVGVYLDSLEGSLSFYSICPDTHILTHLHTYHATFSEPLYAGFWVDCDSSVSLG
ncbi:NLR family CARD domain-containing protein 3-like [Tachysurus fulvidraco]|uniref:NLR family CARD domain-containing protein 3-like n=1 Tax=Tachysurus fulvidraco TaxID=1234273 RepID=UPI001FEFD8F3|nr:NLR family CARD domain-containing protein 3-like [Tachysurus fulvidraco]